MSLLTVSFAVLLNVAVLVFVVGLARKIRSYAKTPAPLKIPTTPAPVTAAGVGWRMAREVVFFESLFKSSKWTWIFGWTFHAALLLVLLRHVRYFQEPVWLPVVLIQPFGTYAGLAMIAALGRTVGTALAGGPRALHFHPIGSPDAGPAAGHWPDRPGHALRQAHRHRGGQSLHAGPDAF